MRAPRPSRLGPPTLVVGAAVLDDLERPTTLLAARRTEPATLAGGWELPGGKVEAGESPLHALHRELLEELGVEVEIGDELPGPDGDGWPMPPLYRMRVWRVRIIRGVPAPIEDHDQVRLLGPGEWLDVAWLPADVPIVRALLAVSPLAGGARKEPPSEDRAPGDRAPGDRAPGDRAPGDRAPGDRAPGERPLDAGA